MIKDLVRRTGMIEHRTVLNAVMVYKYGIVNPEAFKQIESEPSEIKAESKKCETCENAVSTNRHRFCTQCSTQRRNGRMATWRQDNPSYNRSKLTEQYGMTTDQYETLWQAQNGCCAICGRHESQCRGKLHIDHCHSTGRIRGLLCHRCNPGLGHFGDDIAILERAITYLKASISDS